MTKQETSSTERTLLLGIAERLDSDVVAPWKNQPATVATGQQAVLAAERLRDDLKKRAQAILPA